MYYLLLSENNKKSIILHHIDKEILKDKMFKNAKTFLITNGVVENFDDPKSTYYMIKEDEKCYVKYNNVSKGYLYNTSEEVVIREYEILRYQTEKETFASQLANQKIKLKKPKIDETNIKAINIFDELKKNTYFQTLRINVEL